MMDWKAEQLKVATGVTDGSAKKPWVDLTEQELVDLRERVQQYTPMDSIKYGEAIQRATAEALKDKNT